MWSAPASFLLQPVKKMSPSWVLPDEHTQSTVDSLVEAVRQRDALLTLYWISELKPSGRRALSVPDTATGLSALETAVQRFDLAEPPDVLVRLEAAHGLIIQVLLLGGAELHLAGLDGTTACDKAGLGGDGVALGLLAEWDNGDVAWTDAETARATPVRDGLEDWLRAQGFDRETATVVVDQVESPVESGTSPSTAAPPDVQVEQASGATCDADVEVPSTRSEPKQKPTSSFFRHAPIKIAFSKSSPSKLPPLAHTHRAPAPPRIYVTRGPLPASAPLPTQSALFENMEETPQNLHALLQHLIMRQLEGIARVPYAGVRQHLRTLELPPDTSLKSLLKEAMDLGLINVASGVETNWVELAVPLETKKGTILRHRRPLPVPEPELDMHNRHPGLADDEVEEGEIV